MRLTLSDNLMAPYIGAGIGVTRFAAYDSEVTPSMSLALGVQPRLAEHLALRAEVRGYGSLVNDSSQFLCNPEQCVFKVRGRAGDPVAGQYRSHLPLLGEGDFPL